jgi:hypothetical protein
MAKLWRSLAMLMIGLTIGFALGAWFYKAFLDKPTAVFEIGKQKVRGNSSGTFSNDAEVETSDQDKQGVFDFFKRNEKEEQQ